MTFTSRFISFLFAASTVFSVTNATSRFGRLNVFFLLESVCIFDRNLVMNFSLSDNQSNGALSLSSQSCYTFAVGLFPSSAHCCCCTVE